MSCVQCEHCQHEPKHLDTAPRDWGYVVGNILLAAVVVLLGVAFVVTG